MVAFGVGIRDPEGVLDGTEDSEVDGKLEGSLVGRADGVRLGAADGGIVEGEALGLLDAVNVGIVVGTRIYNSVCVTEGEALGVPVGLPDGASVGGLHVVKKVLQISESPSYSPSHSIVVATFPQPSF